MLATNQFIVIQFARYFPADSEGTRANWIQIYQALKANQYLELVLHAIFQQILKGLQQN